MSRCSTGTVSAASCSCVFVCSALVVLAPSVFSFLENCAILSLVDLMLDLIISSLLRFVLVLASLTNFSIDSLV